MMLDKIYSYVVMLVQIMVEKNPLTTRTCINC
jgi:hypothetical protein